MINPTFDTLIEIPNSRLGPTVYSNMDWRGSCVPCMDSCMDPFGNVHVVGVRRTRIAVGVAGEEQSDALIYTRMDAETGEWSIPIDISKRPWDIAFPGSDQQGADDWEMQGQVAIVSDDDGNLMVVCHTLQQFAATSATRLTWRYYDKSGDFWSVAELLNTSAMEPMCNAPDQIGLTSLPSGDFVIAYRTIGVQNGGIFYQHSHSIRLQSWSKSSQTWGVQHIFSDFACGDMQIDLIGNVDIAYMDDGPNGTIAVAFAVRAYNRNDLSTYPAAGDCYGGTATTVPLILLRYVHAFGPNALEPINPGVPFYLADVLNAPRTIDFTFEVYTVRLAANKRSPQRLHVAYALENRTISPQADRWALIVHLQIDNRLVSRRDVVYDSDISAPGSYGILYYGWLDLASDPDGDAHLIYRRIDYSASEAQVGCPINFYMKNEYDGTAWTDQKTWHSTDVAEYRRYCSSDETVALACPPVAAATTHRLWLLMQSRYDTTQSVGTRHYLLFGTSCTNCIDPVEEPEQPGRDDHCPPLPPGWQRVLANPMGVRVCSKVVFDPDGMNINLTPYFVQMRPYVVRKDTELRNFVADDCEMEFVDERNLFMPSEPESLFYDPDLAGGSQSGWLFKEVVASVSVEDFDGPSEELEIFRGRVIGLVNRPGKATLRLGNMFKYLLDHRIAPNGIFGARKIDGDESAPLGGRFDQTKARHEPGVARLETWTVTFTNGGTGSFRVEGSVSGEQGTGSTGAVFNAANGAITILTSAWTTLGNNVWRTGDKIVFSTALGYGAASPSAKTDVFLIMLDVLTNAEYGAGLDASRVLVNEFIAESNSGLSVNIAPIWTEDISVLDVLQELGWHANATIVERTTGAIGVLHYRLVTQRDICLLCYLTDIMEVQTVDRTPIVNEFEFQYDYRVTSDGDFDFLVTSILPATDIENASFQKYGVLERRTIVLRGFDAGQRANIESLSADLTRQYADPQEIVELRMKIDRLNLELSTISRILIEHPKLAILVEPVEISKQVGLAGTEVTGKFRRADFFVTDSCGDLRVGHGFYDDCWAWG